jgi:hypothetical protein
MVFNRTHFCLSTYCYYYHYHVGSFQRRVQNVPDQLRCRVEVCHGQPSCTVGGFYPKKRENEKYSARGILDIPATSSLVSSRIHSINHQSSIIAPQGQHTSKVHSFRHSSNPTVYIFSYSRHRHIAHNGQDTCKVRQL